VITPLKWSEEAIQPEKIIAKLRQVDVLVSQGQNMVGLAMDNLTEQPDQQTHRAAFRQEKRITSSLPVEVYRDEIQIQEARSKHRKLDSHAALPHPTRDRAADGLRASHQRPRGRRTTE